MKNIMLFTDSSVNPQTKIGFGAYLKINEEDYSVKLNQKDFKDKVLTKKFEDTSSTKLELQTLLWALEEQDCNECNIIVFTDCQNILSLIKRKEKLIKSNFISSTGKVKKNKDLYIKFYQMIENKSIKFMKVKGHMKSQLRDDIDKVFNLVDRGSRHALREYLKSL